MAQSNDEGWERSGLYGVATRMKEPPELEESAHHISDRTRRQSKTLGIARTCLCTWADMGLNHFGAMHGRDSTKFDRGELRFIANDVLQGVQRTIPIGGARSATLERMMAVSLTLVAREPISSRTTPWL
jgi:hypothetical protein